MLFLGLPFLFMFLPLFFIVYFAFRKRYARNIVLLVFSLVFYAWGEPLYIFLMIFQSASTMFREADSSRRAAQHKSESIYGSRHRAESASYRNFQICRLFC